MASQEKEAAETMKPWSEVATKRFVEGLTWTIDKAHEIENYQTNGVYQVCLSMQEKLKTTQPHQLPAAALAMKFLNAAASNPKYSEALALAKEKQAWDAFRTTAARVLTVVVEFHSAEQACKINAATPDKAVKPFAFNRGPEKILDIFTQNPILAPHDIENLQAAQLSLFGLWDIQERAKIEGNQTGK